MVTVVTKDLLTVTNGIIAHQVNCKGVMGGGIALQIRKKYPLVYETYMRQHAMGGISLGLFQPVEIKAGSLYVVNMAGQDTYGRTGIHTNYEALSKCLEELYTFGQEKSLPIYLPMFIGCGLGGGDWGRVSGIIEEVCPIAIICKYPGSDTKGGFVVEQDSSPACSFSGKEIQFPPLNQGIKGVLGKSDKPWVK